MQPTFSGARLCGFDALHFLSQDANVYLSLKGTLRTEEEIELDKCLNHADKFERGHEDIFEFRLPPLGDLLSAKIMHDNSGLTNPDVRCLSPPYFVSAVFVLFNSFSSCECLTLPQWHLKEVEVVDTQNGVSFLFSCGKWLSREAAERKELDGNGSCLTDIEGVHLERVCGISRSDFDFRVVINISRSSMQCNSQVLYRFCFALMHQYICFRKTNFCFFFHSAPQQQAQQQASPGSILPAPKNPYGPGPGPLL